MSEGRKYKTHITLTAPADSPICCGINKMSESERTGMKRLFEAAYLNANGRPYSDFKDWIEWAKLQGIKLTVPYQNCMQSTEFIKYISKALFDENIRKKLEWANFIAIFCDRSTNVAVIEKECIYILFADPDNFQPKLTFLSLKDLPSYANGWLCFALFIELLEPTEKFSILSQREDFNIIDMVDCLYDMLLSYQICKRNIDNDPDMVYSFPTVEKLLKNIKIRN